MSGSDEQTVARGIISAWLVAKVMPLLLRLATFLSVGAAAGAYGWWVWRQARRLEEAGVEPPPPPPVPAPGPIPPASPPSW